MEDPSFYLIFTIILLLLAILLQPVYNLIYNLIKIDCINRFYVNKNNIKDTQYLDFIIGQYKNNKYYLDKLLYLNDNYQMTYYLMYRDKYKKSIEILLINIKQLFPNYTNYYTRIIEQCLYTEDLPLHNFITLYYELWLLKYIYQQVIQKYIKINKYKIKNKILLKRYLCIQHQFPNEIIQEIIN